MQTLAPDLSLILWSIFNLVLIGLVIYAIYHIANNKTIQNNRKFAWILIILFVPVLGALIYLANWKVGRAEMRG